MKRHIKNKVKKLFKQKYTFSLLEKIRNIEMITGEEANLINQCKRCNRESDYRNYCWVCANKIHVDIKNGKLKVTHRS